MKEETKLRMIRLDSSMAGRLQAS